MRVLIDIGHPAHVHLFKNVAIEMQKKGHEFLFTCRQKEFEIELLEANGLKYHSFGKKRTGLLGKALGMLEFDYKEWRTALKFKPDVFMSHGSIYAAHAAFATGKPHISLEDTYNFEQVNLYLPFSKFVLTSDYNHPLSNHKKNISYNSYHELSYLHPDRFQPNPIIKEMMGLDENEPYAILRFVAWEATHDVGHSGVSEEMKIRMVKELSKIARVYISSEKELPKDISNHAFKIVPQLMHSAIFYASLMISESATMATEAAVLGVPSIYMDNNGRYYTRDIEEKFGLIYNLSESLHDQGKALKKGIEILSEPDLKSRWQEKRRKLLQDKSDLSALLIWFLENYPSSVNELRDNKEEILGQFT